MSLFTGAILGKLYKIPGRCLIMVEGLEIAFPQFGPCRFLTAFLGFSLLELGGKDVEDLFTAVLSPVTPQPPPAPQMLPIHGQGMCPIGFLYVWRD